MNTQWTHSLGVLGGAGALASAHFHRVLVSVAQREYHCLTDEDFPEFITINHPWKGLDASGVLHSERAILQTQMSDKLTKLKDMGCAVQVIICNSLYGLWPLPPEIFNGSKYNLVSLPSVTMEAVIKSGITRCGLMASKSSMKSMLYDSYAENCQLILPSKSSQDAIEEVIGDTMSGGASLSNSFLLREIARELTKKGAEGIILGCTELSPLLNQSNLNLPLFDSSYYGAKASLEKMKSV